MDHLTPGDWEEIYYALESKINSLKRGDFDDVPTSDCSPQERHAIVAETRKSNREWVRHLQEILRKIGPDGKKMTDRAKP